MEATIVDQHRWLHRLTGTWTALAEGANGQEAEWIESIRTIGDAWIFAEGSGTDPDGKPTVTLMTLGFDPEKEKFVGTFIGSMMTHLWIYEGELDDSGTVLTLETEGPDFEHGRTTRYRDILEYDGGDTRVFRSVMQTGDGQWKQVMSTRFRRTG